jgi:enterochelin esterase-like enzyme
MARLRADAVMVGARAVEEFWKELEDSGAPIVEPAPGGAEHSLVTFVWRGSPEAKSVVITDGVSVGVGGADPLNSLMTHIDGTNVWYRSYVVRNDGRFTYALSENDPMALFSDPERRSNSKADPLSSNRLPIIGQTYVQLPDARTRSWTVPLAPEDSGDVMRLELNGRSLRVYTPPGFQRSGEAYPLVVTMAGGFYADMVELAPTLDHLIAEGRIPPAVAVVVSGTVQELQCSPEYARFLADVLVPWTRANYHATNKPEQTVIAGSSVGGLASACAAVNHPGVFGNVLSQSGSYWWNRIFRSREEGDDLADAESLTRRIRSIDRVPVDFYLEVGLMEFEGQLGTNRRLRDALVEKGYEVDYREFNGNHSYVNWRESFGEALVVLLGERSVK